MAMNHFTEKAPINIVKLFTDRHSNNMHFGAINILLSQMNEAMRNVGNVQVGIEVGQQQQR